jgi:hypothetical protein
VSSAAVITTTGDLESAGCEVAVVVMVVGFI